MDNPQHLTELDSTAGEARQPRVHVEVGSAKVMHGTKPIRQVQFKAAWANAARANREARSFELPLRIRGAVSQPASAASACWRVAAVSGTR